MRDFPFQIVGFDLDGTLLDTHEDLGAAVNHALSLLGRAPVPVTEVRDLIGGGAKKMLEKALLLTGGVPEAEFAGLFQELLRYYEAHIAVHTRLYPGGEAMLDALATEHDVVIVDLPPALIDWLEPLLARAERLLMVTDLAVPSVVRARRIISLLTQDHPKLPVEIVVAHEKKPFRMGSIHRDAETALGRPLRHWLPDEAKLARQALDRGEPLVQLAPRCGWSRAVKAMALDLQTPTRIGAKAAAKGDR